VCALRRSPRPPRVPAGLTTISAWPPDDGAELSGVVLGGDFVDQQREDLRVEGSRITNAALTGSVLHRLHLTDVVVENVDLSGADLDESSFQRVRFRDCRLSAVVLTRCRLVDVTFTDCRLDQANARMSVAASVTFEDVDLREADFYGAVLEHTDFFDCDLTASQFTQARTEHVRLHGSDLTGLQGASHLGGSTIDSSQVLPVALGVLAALDIRVDDDRAAEADGR